MGFSETRARLFPAALPLDRFLTRSRRLLRPYGFTDRNTLAMVGACRDELSLGTVLAVRQHWGPPFLLTSLAGLPTYGRSALAAAEQHAPDKGDGVRRLVAILTTHLGIDRQGNVGQVQRNGQRAATPTCGAMAAWRADRAPGPGRRIHRQDGEMRTLRDRLAREYEDRVTPPMDELAATCRSVIEADFVAVAGDLLQQPGSLTAVFTGLVLHGHPSGDFVDPGSATLFDPARSGPVAL